MILSCRIACSADMNVVHVCWQYFGNLVTCRGWNELWLNEAFALFYQHKAVNFAEPAMHCVSQCFALLAYLLIANPGALPVADTSVWNNWITG